MSFALGIGYHFFARTFINIYKDGAPYLAVALVQNERGGAEVFALQHLDGDGGDLGGMDGEFLFGRTTGHPFVGTGDVPYPDAVAHQAVETVPHAKLCPIVLGIYGAVIKAVGGILDVGGIVLAVCLAGRNHSRGGQPSLHTVIDIAVEEVFVESCTDAHLLHLNVARLAVAVAEDIGVDAADASPKDESLFELGMVAGVGV